MSCRIEKVNRKGGYRYRLVIDKSINGIRKREYKTLPKGTTKVQAEEIRFQIELEEKCGKYLPKAPTLFCDYAENTYFPKYAEYLSPTTQQHYKQLYYTEGGIKEHLGDRYLSDITTEVVQDVVNYHVKTGKAPKTIRNIVNLISVIIKSAQVDNYFDRSVNNPCEYVRLPKIQSQAGNAYDAEQVMLMLKRAKETDNINAQLIIALCCMSGGFRRSELAGLRWEDITLTPEESYICIRRAVVYTNGELIEKETKTKAGNRIIPIPPNGLVYNILLDARKQYMKEQSTVEDFNGENHVFILHHAPYTPVNPNRLYKIFKSFMEKECPDLPCYRLHDLRHTYFTVCSETAGFSELSIIGTGGHSSIQSTRRYQHSSRKRMLEDMNKLEKVYNSVEAVCQ